ncbi:senescence associated gene 20 [Ziziphus jujuba]|uniref:Senescence associated gene 20 n=1 Tax=Ziziphus jujuba TaxID=326968 RepID=A0A6P4AQL6_ZIZJJ|nr:senescence associated gene 20 [Ziziphus jujuba]
MAAKEAIVESPLPNQQELENRATVETLYKALAQGQTETAASLLASDLEWWFHGPPRCNHMMRVLTGEASHTAFLFEPRSVTAIGDCVIVEGWEGAKVYWVHVWTLKNGVITQFREYFNTWLTVRDVRPPRWEIGHDQSLTLWQSQPRDLFRRSLPGLLLAI